MTDDTLQAVTRHLAQAAVVDLTGEINSSAEPILRHAYDQAESQDPGTILLNFERVSYINSTGIALIVSLLGRARAGGRRLLACGLSDHYVEIFNITRLADFMSVFPTESAALRDPVSAASNGETSR